MHSGRVIEVSQRFRLKSMTLQGMEAIPVSVEIDVGPGLPGFSIIGAADHVVQESKERVRSALRHCDFNMPSAKIVVNLAPAMLRKSGTGFDLPIALALLCATGQVNGLLFKEAFVVGELSLEGEVQPIQGMLAYALGAKEAGGFLVCSPASELMGCTVGAVRCLASLDDLHEKDPWCAPFGSLQPGSAVNALDFADIAGNEVAKRALVIAAAGRHNTLMIGSPGSGKTMLAQRFPSILPPLTKTEIQESAVLHSIAGMDISRILEGEPPIRSPHHSASAAGLMGGGNPIRPGEVSLAHNGVLFLDEMSEFTPSVLQQLRQPLEDGKLCIVRADRRIWFPADFLLIGASNPCPCGFLGDPERNCTCTDAQLARYANRIGGPLLDRMDISLEVWRSKPGEVLRTGMGLSSHDMRDQVLSARERIMFRERKRDGDAGSGEQGKDRRILDECGLGDAEHKLLESLSNASMLSGRGIMRTLRVARTIADLEGSPNVKCEHLLEAVTYRMKEAK